MGVAPNDLTPGCRVHWGYRPSNYHQPHYDSIARLIELRRNTARILVRRLSDGHMVSRFVKRKRLHRWH